jgi:hypothetical protein
MNPSDRYQSANMFTIACADVLDERSVDMMREW